jgi:AcrR family transcriptional regulator
MGARVGRPTSINLDSVSSAGVALVKRAGLESVTFTAVANELGISPRSLYHHLDGVSALRWIVIDQIIASLPTFDPDVQPAEALDEFARAARRVLLAHPGVAEQLLQFGTMTDAVYSAVDRCVGCYQRTGMSQADAGRCAAMFLSWLLSVVPREKAFTITPTQLPEDGPGGTMAGVDSNELFEFELRLMIAATVSLGTLAR